MWEILEQFDFSVESELAIPVHCVLCNHILIDACQGPCGCLYCRCCIGKYLQNSLRYCPGNNHLCKSVKLDMDSNVTTDNNANYKISQLQTKCPSESCDFLSALINMCNHSRVCDKLPISCPYRPMGCVAKPMLMDQLAEHLQIEIYSHNKSLVKWIMHMKNDNHSLSLDQKSVEMENELERLFEKLSVVMTKKQVVLYIVKLIVLLFQALIGNMYNDLKEFQDKIVEIGSIVLTMKQINERNINEIRMLSADNSKKVYQFKEELNDLVKRLQQELHNHKLKSKKRQVKVI